uniref:Calcineurin-like phosphoesterase domain-containing protein n=1 Tax=Fervidobacterium pennivorans TaxID=93466 RepID=A0A7V4NFY5_FERPE
MKFSRKVLVGILILFAVVLLFAETREIVILHTSDLHGYIYPVDYATNKPANYGLAKVASVIKEQRQKYGEGNVIVIDTGDLIQGSPMEYYQWLFLVQSFSFYRTCSFHMISMLKEFQTGIC